MTLTPRQRAQISQYERVVSERAALINAIGVKPRTVPQSHLYDVGRLSQLMTAMAQQLPIDYLQSIQ